MSTPSVNSDPSVLFDADAYEAEFGAGRPASFDIMSDNGSWTSVETTSDMDDVNHPRYVPPHKRYVNLDMGDNTVVPPRDPENKPDAMGVDNRHFQKLLIYVSFALSKANILALCSRFPAMFFQSTGHHNHDHPIAHVVTQVGTRLLQRMIPSGSRVLDIYGSPISCKKFNASQAKSKAPKVMEALVNRFCPADFIREINKWGPRTIEGVQQYQVGKIGKQTAQYLNTFSVFQMIHTLYYINVEEVAGLLDIVRGAKVFALVHTHGKSHGWLNGGEQEYWVKGGIVRQRNVATNTTYCHPDITPFWFKAKKEFYIPGSDIGITWECHFVCEDTWIIEIVGCRRSEMEDDFLNDWEAQFEAAAAAELSVNTKPARAPAVSVLPTHDGKFVELNLVCDELLATLRRRAAGRSREGKNGRKLLEDLFLTAKHAVSPGALFPDAPALSCPDHLIADHVVAAFVSDIAREDDLFKAVDTIQPAILAHATRLRGGANINHFSLSSLLEILRSSVKLGVSVHRIVRSKDVVGSALGTLEEALADS